MNKAKAIDKKVNRAASVIAYYEQIYAEDELETTLGDLLADLMHLADAHGIDFGDVAYIASRHHKDEVNE